MDKKRVNLISRLQESLDNLYHNATVNYPTLEGEYEQELFQGWFEGTVRFELEDLEHDSVHGELVKKYGKVYQYGRGGRTVSPRDFMTIRGNVKRVESLDLEPFEARRLIKQIDAFNESVSSWCKAVPELWKDAVEANEWQSEIDVNKGKRKKIRTVVSWE